MIMNKLTDELKHVEHHESNMGLFEFGSSSLYIFLLNGLWLTFEITVHECINSFVALA